MNQRLSDIWKFITYDIWRITESEVTRTKFSIYNIIKTIYLCVNRFNKDRIVNKASALTYSTLLAIVSTKMERPPDTTIRIGINRNIEK
jgi:membrane protein